MPIECNLIIKLCEVTIRGYSIIEDEGIIHLVAGHPKLKMTYEEDEKKPGSHMILISAPDQESLFKFLAFAEMPVHIIT